MLTLWKAAVRNSCLKHLLTFQLHLIWLSGMTHAVIVWSAEDLFLLFCALICWIQRTQLKLTLIRLFPPPHFGISKALQISRWKLFVSCFLDRHAGHVPPSGLMLQFLWSCHQLLSVTWGKSLLYWGHRGACLCWSAHECDIWGKGGEVRGKKKNWKGNSGIGYL